MDFYPYDVIILVVIGITGCLSLLGALLEKWADEAHKKDLFIMERSLQLGRELEEREEEIIDFYKDQ